MTNDNDYIKEVLGKLQNNPTAQDLDYFIEAFSRVGYLSASARSIADFAEAERKYNFATEFARAKSNGVKTSADAEAAATIATRDSLAKEIRAREVATKVSNLYSAIEQNINAIKFLNRATDVMLPRR